MELAEMFRRDLLITSQTSERGNQRQKVSQMQTRRGTEEIETRGETTEAEAAQSGTTCTNVLSRDADKRRRENVDSEEGVSWRLLSPGSG